MKNSSKTMILTLRISIIICFLCGTLTVSFSKQNNILKIDSLPDDMPMPELILKNNPSPGGIFLSPIISGQATATYSSYLMILDT
jgi:hypothetical protein